MAACLINRLFFQTVRAAADQLGAGDNGIINMIYNWNKFIFVNTFISLSSYKTLNIEGQNFIGQYTTDWGSIGATLMISILLISVMFLCPEDRIVEGIAAGSAKG